MTSKTRSDCTGKMCFTVARWRVNEYKFCLSRWVVHGCEAEGNNFELLGAETLCHVSPFLVLVCDIKNAMQRLGIRSHMRSSPDFETRHEFF